MAAELVLGAACSAVICRVMAGPVQELAGVMATAALTAEMAAEVAAFLSLVIME